MRNAEWKTGRRPTPVAGGSRSRLRLPWLVFIPHSAFRIPHLRAFRIPHFRVDPTAASVRGVLLLPDGDDLLYRVDGEPARGERLGPVRTAHRNGDAHLADPEPPEPVDQRD